MLRTHLDTLDLSIFSISQEILFVRLFKKSNSTPTYKLKLQAVELGNVSHNITCLSNNADGFG